METHERFQWFVTLSFIAYVIWLMVDVGVESKHHYYQTSPNENCK